MQSALGASSYQVAARGEYTVMLRNRTDQPIYEVAGIVGFRIGDRDVAASGNGWLWKGTMLPGDTAQATAQVGGAQGWSADQTDSVTLSAKVDRVRFKDCVYLPSRSYRLAPDK
jgi:hypothetical protein